MLSSPIKGDMTKEPDWLEIIFTRINHNLELAQTIKILIVDESIEDFCPHSKTVPIFTAGSVVEATVRYHYHSC